MREFYRLNHHHKTLDFVRGKERQYLGKTHRVMGIWEAMEFLNTLVDDSDPDTTLTQIEHLMQAAEAIRADGHPRWFIVTGLIHDLGKILCLFGEPQWAVVGDTFPVGCRYSDRIVFSEFFQENPDSRVARYQTDFGIYEPHCGLDRVHMAWGHDEYLYHVTKDRFTRKKGWRHPLPLVLRRSPRRGLQTFDESGRSAPDGLGPRLQPVRPLLEGTRAARRGGAQTYLPRPDRRVLPGKAGLVSSDRSDTAAAMLVCAVDGGPAHYEGGRAPRALPEGSDDGIRIKNTTAPGTAANTLQGSPEPVCHRAAQDRSESIGCVDRSARTRDALVRVELRLPGVAPTRSIVILRGGHGRR